MNDRPPHLLEQAGGVDNLRKQADVRKTTAERFWAKVDQSGECWTWMAGKDSKGYGSFWIAPTMKCAHRVAYELTRGPVPDGLEIDHLCRNRACVRPEHLEAVTHHVNVRRSPFTAGSVNAVKTHCPRGHAYDAANTRITRVGGRICRECKRIASRADYHRAKAV